MPTQAQSSVSIPMDSLQSFPDASLEEQVCLPEDANPKDAAQESPPQTSSTPPPQTQTIIITEKTYDLFGFDVLAKAWDWAGADDEEGKALAVKRLDEAMDAYPKVEVRTKVYERAVSSEGAMPLGVCMVMGCRAEWIVADQDGDLITIVKGDCWDADEGPAGSGLSGADIHPGATEKWYDGIDQDCGGDDDYDADKDGFVDDANVGLTTLGVPGTGDLVGGDCNDDPEKGGYDVNPDVLEYCNDEDDDCDGEVDEEAQDPVTSFVDEDEDGYGDSEAWIQECEVPEGYVDNADDCDDGDASINLDEEWYEDVDGDGYGDPESSIIDCEQPEGHVDNGEDCNDEAFFGADEYPGAPEECDGADNDCDGVVDEGC